MLHARLRAAAGRDRIPTDGLVAWYTMDNISGSTLVDEMGNYDGTISGATQAAGVIGQALSFDGSNDYVTLSSAILSSTTSISIWVNPQSADNVRYVLSHRDGTSNNRIYLIYDDSAGVIRFIYGGTNIVEQAISASSWSHLCITFDGSTEQRLYVDGSLSGTGSASISGGYSGNFRLGTSPIASDGFLLGSEDQLRIYNRVISSSEVISLYNEGA